MRDDSCQSNESAGMDLGGVKTAFVQWGLLALLFNTGLVAENMYYHEDLLGHIARHGVLLIVFAIVANGLLSAGLLCESYWRVFVGPPRPAWVYLFRLVVFAVVLGFFADLVRDFYLAHPVPHHPN